MKKILLVGIIALFLLNACDQDTDGHPCCTYMDDSITFTLADDSPAGAIPPGDARILMAIDVTCTQSAPCFIFEMTFSFSSNPEFFHEFWLEDDEGIISANIVQLDNSNWTADTTMVFSLTNKGGRSKKVYLVSPLYESDLPEEEEIINFQLIMTDAFTTALYQGHDVLGNTIYAGY